MHEISWWQTDTRAGEAGRAAAAVAAGQLSDGPIVADFEARVADALGVPYAIAAPSGSLALLMSMLALEIGPGDEVIVPDYTWIASAHAASVLGARIVLVDVCAERPVIDVEDVARKLTSRTKAIVPVHLCGRANDTAALRELIKGRDIHIVEDACQALFSRGAEGYLGTGGDIGCFSFGVAKLLTSGQGGVAVTRDPEIYKRLRRVKTHGVTNEDTDWERYVQPGLNFKFSDVLASLGLEQLERAEARIAHVREIYRRYEAGLANLPKLRVSPIDLAAGELPLWTEIESPHVEAIQAFLGDRGIQTRRVHPPLSEVPYFPNGVACPNSERFCHQILVLPSGPAQPHENVDRVVETLRDFALR